MGCYTNSHLPKITLTSILFNLVPYEFQLNIYPIFPLILPYSIPFPPTSSKKLLSYNCLRSPKLHFLSNKSFLKNRDVTRCFHRLEQRRRGFWAEGGGWA